jgi:YbbR domain-containing protein
VRRGLRFLLRNWPLKLGAVLLATVLYSGFVLSHNVRTFNGPVTIEPLRQPTDTALLTDLPDVSQIRYQAPLDVGLPRPDSFSATVNLAGIEPRADGSAVDVPVTVTAVDRRIVVVDYFPRTIQVRLDPVDTRSVGVTVNTGAIPEGLTIGPPQVDPPTVDVRGAASRVAAIRTVIARVTIDPSALNVDRQVDLTAVDEQGNQVPNVVLEPARVRVRIAVARELANRTLPVVPEFSGTLPAGFRIESVTVVPPVVTVSGEQAAVTQMDGAHTVAIDLGGRTRDFETVVGLALPGQVAATGGADIRVALTIVEETGTRSYQAGIALVGARSDRLYVLSTSSVDITLGGTISQLNALDAGALVATVAVADLAVGDHGVGVEFTPTGGYELVSVTPAQITVTVQEPMPSPTPSPTAVMQAPGRVV